MNSLQLFLPCAAGVEEFLADEVHHLTGLTGHDLLTGRGGVDPADDQPGFWIEHRRWLLLVGALLLAWLIVESALAWDFLDG